MDLKKCSNCNDLFAASAGQRICPDCLAEEEEKFQLVKDYLWDHPGATISDISEATEVGEPIIEKFVREGRFIEVGGANLKIECQKCGAPISQGKYCSDCSNQLASNIQKSKQKKKSKENRKKDNRDRMFTRD
ncbi:MAG: TIGR03826 family flagellar region protein [Bacillota bacterium]